MTISEPLKQQIIDGLPIAIKKHFGTKKVLPDEVRAFAQSYLTKLRRKHHIPEMTVTLFGDMYTGDLKITLGYARPKKKAPSKTKKLIKKKVKRS